MIEILRDLLWLPRAPADFRQRCKDFLGAARDAAALRHLASHALDINQLTRLAQLVEHANRAGVSLRPLVPFRLGIVSNATTSLIAPALVATALRHGIALEVIDTPFNQGMAEALDPNSSLCRARPDAVLIAIDYRGLPLRSTPGAADAARRTIDEALACIRAIREGLRRAGSAIAIVQSLAAPPNPLFGSLDRQVPGTTRALVDAFNSGLADELRGSGDVLFDAAALAETVGLAAWHDPGQWTLAKLPFSQDLVPLYADYVCRLLGALHGKSRRCLVMDLDNTLWGGVIGDDGLDGIVIGQGSAAGEAHLLLQRYALELRERGIVLAVASKNDDAVAREPFRLHPEMLLRLEHIAVFQANWSDKATNLIAIADALSLGRESMVFVDDNPAERELIRQQLPEVAIPELPKDPALYAETLAAAGYFETLAFSSEDRQRASYYQDNARRLELRSAAVSLDEYLASLEMTASFAPFDGVSRARIAQLINKSNQFNLTTRRYTEAEVAELERDAGVFTMQVRLADRFGDNGMISVVICRTEGAGRMWEIDTWLMSCRVLKRRLEDAVLNELVRHARAAGALELRGTYIPTARNGMVADHYAVLGFHCVARDEDGRTEWVLMLDEFEPRVVPMRTVSTGFPDKADVAQTSDPEPLLEPV
jgi:FkbH-like protein